MKRSLLNKIIRPHAKPWRLVVSFAGLGLGLAGLLLAVQLHHDFERLFSTKERSEADHDYLILSKSVAIDDTFKLTPPAFSEEDIARVREQPFVLDLGKITGSAFRVSMAPIGPIQFYTELFLEAVPARMLDEPPEDWGWKEGDEVVPALLSSEFLNLYNFVFAPGQGLPPLTRDALKMLSIPLYIGSGESARTVATRIAGYSDRITSVLVPDDFLLWANEQYGTQAEPPPSRLIVKVTDASDPMVGAFLEKEGIETNRDRLRKSKTAAAARFAVIVTALVSLLVAGLAVLSAAMNTQLLIAQSATAMGLLSQLGYARRALIRWLMIRHLTALALVLILGSAVFILCHLKINALFVANGFPSPGAVSPSVYFILPVFALAELLLQYTAIRRSLYNLAI